MIKKKPEWFIVISSFDFASVKVERKETCSTVFETGKGAFVFPSFFLNKNVPVDRHHHSNVINDLFTNTLFSFELFHVSIITGTTEIVYSIYQMIS